MRKNKMCVITSYSIHYTKLYDEKGVPLDSIEAVVGQNEFPAAMKKAYEMVLEQMKETRMVVEDAPDYVKKLVDQISAMITHIEFQLAQSYNFV